ncbi:MAG: LysR substrate-binding domain-containing protein [Planctomycetota bacterium]
MDGLAPMRSLLSIWPWLPQFRAIAETEHLPSAATICGVGASSLSRTLGLLERALGQQLFERTGRTLRLNHHGEALLAAVREAMRRVDDARHELAQTGLTGPLRISSLGAGTTALVAPAVQRLRQEHPEVVPQLLTRPLGVILTELMRGELDVAFQEDPIQHDSLTVRRIADLTRAVYVPRGHALFDEGDLQPARLADLDFVAPPQLRDGTTPDGWPPELQRRIAVTADQLRVGLELCLTQGMLAVLPDVLAAQHGGDLRRVEAVSIAPTPVFAVHRTVLGRGPTAASRLVELAAS